MKTLLSSKLHTFFLFFEYECLGTLHYYPCTFVDIYIICGQVEGKREDRASLRGVNMQATSGLALPHAGKCNLIIQLTT